MNNDNTITIIGHGRNKVQEKEKKVPKVGFEKAKIDKLTDEGIFEIKTINTSVSKAIQESRRVKNLTQKDLALKINETAKTVNEYESGKVVPTQQVLAKMEKVLNIKLRGKDIGKEIGKAL